MKSEQVAIVASAGAATGVAIHMLGGKISTGNETWDTVIGVTIGAIVAGGSFLLSKDGFSDFGIGGGVGYMAASVF